MSNQNILKKLKQRFSHRDEYDFDNKLPPNTLKAKRSVHLKGYCRANGNQDSLSDTETLSSTNKQSRRGQHVCTHGTHSFRNSRSTNTSPAIKQKLQRALSPNQGNTIVSKASTKIVQPTAYACCVNRVKIIDNCCGRTEHNIIYHQHHPIVGVGASGELALGVSDRTVLDITDTVCRASTAPRLKSIKHCPKCCNCEKVSKLQTLPLRYKETKNKENCTECEKEKNLKAKSVKSRESLACTCGLKDIEDNMKNKALERATSFEAAASQSSSQVVGYSSTDHNAPSMAGQTIASCTNKHEVHQTSDQKTAIKVYQPKDISVSDDETRYLGSTSSGYCTQSDDCTDVSSPAPSFGDNVAVSTSLDPAPTENPEMQSHTTEHSFNLSASEDTESQTHATKPPNSLNIANVHNPKAGGAASEDDITPPPIPERNYRTNSFYKKHKLQTLALNTEKSTDTVGDVPTGILISLDDSPVKAQHEPEEKPKVSPPLLTRRSEQSSGCNEFIEADESGDCNKTPVTLLDEPIHMTMEEVWLDAQSHGIPLTKPAQCDRTYSTPESCSHAPQCMRSTSVPKSITTPVQSGSGYQENESISRLSAKDVFCFDHAEQEQDENDHAVSTCTDAKEKCECEGICAPEQLTVQNMDNFLTLSTSPTSSMHVNDKTQSEIPPMLPPKRRNRSLVNSSSCGNGLNSCQELDMMMVAEDVEYACVNEAEEDSSADFVDSLRKLKDCGWYWGPLSWVSADAKLSNKPDGSFLVRDSSDDRYILSLSFRTQGKTHHTRIEHFKGTFSFYSQPKSHGAGTIIEFIEKAMEHSCNGKFLYFLRPPAQGLPPAPVQLLYPVSRFRLMQSLQHLCRFSILRCTRYDHIDFLPLPPKIKFYLKESQYYTEYLQDDQVCGGVSGQTYGQYTSDKAL